MDVFKKFLCGQTSLGIGIAKISLKNLNSFLGYLEKPKGGQNDPPLSPLKVNARQWKTKVFQSKIFTLTL